jgi:hypothetical protein
MKKYSGIYGTKTLATERKKKMVESLLAKLLQEGPIAILMGVIIYAQYRMYIDQIKYNREQDKLTADILSKLVPVVEGLKEGALRTASSLDRNLGEFVAGNDRLNDRITAMTGAIERLEISLNAFMSHIKGGRE